MNYHTRAEYGIYAAAQSALLIFGFFVFDTAAGVYWTPARIFGGSAVGFLFFIMLAHPIVIESVCANWFKRQDQEMSLIAVTVVTGFVLCMLFAPQSDGVSSAPWTYWCAPVAAGIFISKISSRRIAAERERDHKLFEAMRDEG